MILRDGRAPDPFDRQRPFPIQLRFLYLLTASTDPYQKSDSQ